jgi:nitronate monooxygenase
MEKLMKTWLSEKLNIKYPIIMAPMFLVSNKEMLITAHHSGITGCIPSLNFRTNESLDQALTEIHQATDGNFGVNLIANKSNLYLKDHLKITIKNKPKFIITSLGNPVEIIRQAHEHNILVFCDVVDLQYAKKVAAAGADAIIAVNSGAGGHAGPLPSSILVPQLTTALDLPIINAGGVASGQALLSAITLGAQGVSMGTPFIASAECKVSAEYKQAIIDYGAADIAMTTKLSGTPCTVIKTPYVKKIGLEQNIIEKTLQKNKRLKKMIKTLTYYKGTKLLEKAAFSSSYKTLWCAGPSLEGVSEIRPIKEIVETLMQEVEQQTVKLKDVL